MERPIFALQTIQFEPGVRTPDMNELASAGTIVTAVVVTVDGNRDPQKIEMTLRFRLRELSKEMAPMDYQRWIAQELRSRCEDWLQATVADPR